MSRLARLRDQDGVTLPELLVTMALLSVVTGGLILGMTGLYRGSRYTNQDSDTLAALRITLDRFEKEVRQARRILTGSGPKHAYFWVDYNGDYSQQASERIHWEVQDIGAGRARFVRWTDAAPAVVRSLSGDLVFDAGETNFEYPRDDPSRPLEEVTSILVSLTALGEGTLAEERSVRTEVRLRNAEL